MCSLKYSVHVFFKSTGFIFRLQTVCKTCVVFMFSEQCVDINIGLGSAMINTVTIARRACSVSCCEYCVECLHTINWNFVCKAGLVAGTDFCAVRVVSVHIFHQYCSVYVMYNRLVTYRVVGNIGYSGHCYNVYTPVLLL